MTAEHHAKSKRSGWRRFKEICATTVIVISAVSGTLHLVQSTVDLYEHVSPWENPRS